MTVNAHVHACDFGVLTPGHFLIGRLMISVPEKSVLDV